MPSETIAILGGGIAGLASAFYVRKAGHTPTVFEASDRFGGKMVTRTLEGCVAEGGPDSLLTEKPWALELCRELGLEDHLLPSNDHQRSFSILHNGRLHPFPAGCKLFIPQKVTPILTTSLLTLPGKLRMLSEPFLRHTPPEGDESLADFTRRHFGEETLQRLAGPLLGGIYGGDPEDMSMAATFPRLQAMEAKHGSLVRGMAGAMKAARARQRQGKAPSLFTSLTPGMQALPDALADTLDGHLRPNTPVSSLAPTDEGWTVNGETFDRVIVALPARQAAPLFESVDPDLSAQLSLQASSSSATLSLVFDRGDLKHEPHGFGFMAAHPLKSVMVGCTWTGNKFDHREAEDRFLCRMFLGGPRAEDAIAEHNDADLESEALHALRDVCPFLPAQPLASWLQRWPNGNPGYAVGHPAWLTGVRNRAEALGHLHFAGSSYEGVSVSDCVRQAQDLAKHLSSPGT